MPYLHSHLLMLLLVSVHTTLANHEAMKVNDEFKQSFVESKVVEIPDPTDVEFSRDGKLMLVTNKLGKLWVVEDFDTKRSSDVTKTEALDISSRLCTNGERGLGGVAFHPNFGDTNRWIYLYYTYENDSGCYAEGKLGRGPVNRLSRFTLSKSYKVDVSSEEVFFETPPVPKNHHNAGDIAFGKDGFLFVTVGDGGTRTSENKNNVPYAQALDKLFGKIVRLTDDGGIPEDNPYTPASGYVKSARCSETGGEAKSPDIKCQEIYASGLRNPWRFAHDPNAGGVRFYINDVGRKTWERVLDGQMGANYGYPEREGPCRATEAKNCKPNPDYDDAIHWYRHDDEDGGAVTGAAFYPNDAGWPESFVGSYLYAEYARGGIYSIKEGGVGCSYPMCDPPVSSFDSTKKVLSGMKKVVSMQFGPYRGGKALYVVSRGDTGNGGDEGIFRIAYSGEAGVSTIPNKAPVSKVSATPRYGFAPLTVNFEALALDLDGDSLSYTWDFDDGGADSNLPITAHTFKSAGEYHATLTVKDGKGGQDTVTVTIEVSNTPPMPVIESPAEGDTFSVGEKLKFVGSATDQEDDEKDLTLTWEVRIHHNDHYHQILPHTEGKKAKLQETPEPVDLASVETSYLIVRLTATDSEGLSTTVERVVKPEIVELNIDTEPSGLIITANGETFTAPASIKTWSNQVVSVEANSQVLDGIDYVFKKWSNGGKKSHKLVVSSDDDSLRVPIVATFRRTSPFVDIGSPADGSTFAVGDTLALSGDALDVSGNPLPDSLLTWEVRIHRDSDDSIYETLLASKHGRYVEKPIVDPEKLVSASELYRLEVILTATDPTGPSSRKSIILMPRKVDIVFNSHPVEGLYLLLDGEKHRTPVTITTWENHKITMEAPSQSMKDGLLTYTWESWSDGGGQVHEFVALPDMVTNDGKAHEVVANFRPVRPWSEDDPDGSTNTVASGGATTASTDEKDKPRGIGMIVVSGLIFFVTVAVCLIKARDKRLSSARKTLSMINSADSSTANETPPREAARVDSPPGSIMHGIDLDDSFYDNDVEHPRRGSLDFGKPTNQTFGDSDFAEFGVGDSSSDVGNPPVPVKARAVSILRGDFVYLRDSRK